MALIHVAVVGEEEEPIQHAVRELGLVEVDRGKRGALTTRLTSMGQLLARGMDL